MHRALKSVSTEARVLGCLRLRFSRPSGYSDWVIIMMPVMMITMITIPGPTRSIIINLMIHSDSNCDVNDTESHHQVNHNNDVIVTDVTLSTPSESDHGRMMPGESEDSEVGI